MKKTILLIFMFIAMFFVGSNSALAATCKVGDYGCDEASIKNLYADDETLLLSCLYKVQVQSGAEYYNYIYYNTLDGYFMAGSTAVSLAKKDLKVLMQNSPPYLLGGAFDSLDNFQCPSNSYIDKNWRNEICFDDGDGSCLAKNGYLVNFNNTTSSSIPVDDAESAEGASTGTSYEGACYDNNPLKNEYGNLCRYKD